MKASISAPDRRGLVGWVCGGNPDFLHGPDCV